MRHWLAARKKAATDNLLEECIDADIRFFWCGVLSVIIGVIIASAFSAILVYATELVPGKVGMIAGLFFGFAFGMGGLGSAVLGKLADITSVGYVFKICAFLPLIGIITGLLPNIEQRKQLATKASQQ